MELIIALLMACYDMATENGNHYLAREIDSIIYAITCPTAMLTPVEYLTRRIDDINTLEYVDRASNRNRYHEMRQACEIALAIIESA